MAKEKKPAVGVTGKAAEGFWVGREGPGGAGHKKPPVFIGLGGLVWSF